MALLEFFLIGFSTVATAFVGIRVGLWLSKKQESADSEFRDLHQRLNDLSRELYDRISVGEREAGENAQNVNERIHEVDQRLDVISGLLAQMEK